MQSEISADSLRDVYAFVKGSREYQAVLAVMGGALLVGLAVLMLDRFWKRGVKEPLPERRSSPQEEAAAAEAFARITGDGCLKGGKKAEVLLVSVFIALLCYIVYVFFRT